MDRKRARFDFRLPWFPPIGTPALRPRFRSHGSAGIEIMDLEFRVQYRPRRCVVRTAFLRAQAVSPNVLPKRIQRGKRYLRGVFHVVEGVSHAYLPPSLGETSRVGPGVASHILRRNPMLVGDEIDNPAATARGAKERVSRADMADAA